MKNNPWKIACFVLGAVLAMVLLGGQAARIEKPAASLAVITTQIPVGSSGQTRNGLVLYRMNGDGSVDFRYLFPPAHPCGTGTTSATPWERLSEARCP